MIIRNGLPDDARIVLARFDEAVAWLAERGQTGQWGTERRTAQHPVPSGAPNSFAGVAAMTMCPRCGSSFLQPLRCEAKGSDVVLVELRCGECMTWLKAPHTRADMRELDRLQAEHRNQIVDQYERLVAESMEALAACLGPALQLDLVSADDFARRR